jgi:hypothetical protein
MDDPVLIYIVGTAGSGKTVLSSNFARWMVDSRHDAIIVNLDPGADELPYEPEVDIREWLKLADIQAEYGLGPNGAQVLCADMLALNISDVKKEIDKIDTDYVLVDTPGQIELFAFRESSRVLTETLGTDRSLIAFLFDSALAKQPTGMVSLMMLSATVQFRFSLPSIGILSKADLLSPDECERVVGWSADPETLMSALAEGAPEEAPVRVSMQSQLSIEFFKAMESLGAFGALTPVSAEAMTGIEDIYNLVQQSFSGGDEPEKR